MTHILYFDYAATTPCAPEVADAMHATLIGESTFANASSAHGLAYTAEAAIRESRRLVGLLINGDPQNVIFTSGGTESNNLALLGLGESLRNSHKPHIVSSATEHKAILDTLKHLVTLGHKVTLVKPDQNGVINVEDIKRAMTTNTGLVSIMHVNNETGVVQNLAEIGEVAKKYRAAFHVDAAQSAGKLPIDVKAMNIDLLSICAHKFYGPKGSGALYINNRLRKKLAPLLHGGGQEQSIRPGTYANHQIVGLGKAVELAMASMENDLVHARQIRAALIEILGDTIADINGNPDTGLPNILNVSVDGVDATSLLASLQNKVALATGSACNSGTVSPSHVLAAMKLNNERISNAIRISFGRYTTLEQAKSAGQTIKSEVGRIKSFL